MHTQLLFFLVIVIKAASAGFSNMVTTIDGIPEHCLGTVDTSPFVKIGQKYYYVDNKNLVNWFTAAHKCRLMAADLATIESADEMNAITKYLFDNKIETLFWISSNDLAKEGNFENLGTGKKMTYNKWAPAQPDDAVQNEDCVHIFATGDTYMWNDRTCTHEIYYICQAREPKTLAFTVW